MILPTKHLDERRSLVSVGAGIIGILHNPRTISSIWNEFKAKENQIDHLPYDWFILALDFLFTIGAIDVEDGLIRRKLP